MVLVEEFDVLFVVVAAAESYEIEVVLATNPKKKMQLKIKQIIYAL